MEKPFLTVDAFVNLMWFDVGERFKRDTLTESDCKK